MAVYGSNTNMNRRSTPRSSSPRNQSTSRNTAAPVTPIAPPAPLPPPPSQIPPTANPVGKARSIANRSKSPIEKARATVSPAVTPAPTQPEPAPTPRQPFGCGTPGAGDWGMAAKQNDALREANRVYDSNLKKVVVKEPPYYYVNILITQPGGPVVTTAPCPNPNYIAEAPPTPPTPDPERPPKTILEEIVDKIIQDSEETVKEIEVKQEPVREPVIPVQDIVQPPPPITPIETVLENQANCQKDVEIPNINIVNEFNPVIDLNTTATASISADVSQEQTVELRAGCMDPDAINYDPAAFIDNGTCEYEPPVEEEETASEPEPDKPVKLNIPDFNPFTDSHGNVIFTVPKDLVESTENGDPRDFIIPISSVETPANLDLIENITRPASGDSDLIISEEAIESSNKKAIREAVGGELADDNPLPTDQDVVIIGDREQLKPKLVRNDAGIIILSSEDDIKLSVDLRCQSFKYKNYQKAIDTKVEKLVGKL